MPNRIIKESIRTSDTLSKITPEAERLFWRLVVSVDDFGRFDARPNIVLGQCMSAFIGDITTNQISSWMAELEKAKLLKLYVDEDRPYLYLTKWDKHQSSARAHKSKFPTPPGIDDKTSDIPDEKDVEDRIYSALKDMKHFNNEVIVTVDRQLRVGERYLDIVLRTETTAYVFELKRSRLSNKAINQIVDYLELVSGRGILIGSGLSANFDLERCVENGISVITFDDELSWSIVFDGGFISKDTLPNVKSREITLKQVNPNNVFVFENVNEIVNDNEDENGKQNSSSSLDEFTLIARAFQDEGFGTCSPIIHDKLKMLYENFGYEWVIDAFTESVAQNVRRLSYVESILGNWKAEGHVKNVNSRLDAASAKEVRRGPYVDDSIPDSLIEIERKRKEITEIAKSGNEH